MPRHRASERRVSSYSRNPSFFFLASLSLLGQRELHAIDFHEIPKNAITRIPFASTLRAYRTPRTPTLPLSVILKRSLLRVRVARILSPPRKRSENNISPDYGIYDASSLCHSARYVCRRRSLSILFFLSTTNVNLVPFGQLKNKKTLWQRERERERERENHLFNDETTHGENLWKRNARRIPPLLTCAGNWSRTITSDQTVYNNLSLSFSFELVGTTSLYRNYWEVINLLFALPISLYLDILKTQKILQFLGQNILDVIGTSFQHKRLRWQLIADHNEWPNRTQ